MKKSLPSRTRLAAVGTAALLLGSSGAALAVPSYARQTGMACEACHTVFPELTHFGRMFKAGGYVIDNLKAVKDVNMQREETLSLASLPPLSIMVQISDTLLSKPLADSNPGITGNSQNGTVGFPQQASIFYAGKIAPHVGAFLQLTYGYDSGTIGIDNTDIRFANFAPLPDDQSLIYGVSLNNNPSVQDLWNTTPAFGFPYAASAAAPGVPFGTQVDGGRAQDVAGLTVYAMLNEQWYGEVGLYRSAKQGAGTGPLDSTTPGGVVTGTAPYYRFAYEYNHGSHSLSAGVYGFNVNLYPDVLAAQNNGSGYGHALTGPSDRYRDVAEDLQYQYVADEHLFSLLATHIHEKQYLDASSLGSIGLAANAQNDLTTNRAYATYYYRRKIGGTVGTFSTTGSADAVIAPNGPDTRGWIAEVNYLPWLNIKLSAQYTAYSRYSGLSTNYDGAGRNARDNNALYLLVWLAY